MATPQEQSHLERAGNHGDVLKHIVLMAAIKAQQKAHPEGIILVDTHCGPGAYNLGEQVRKTKPKHAPKSPFMYRYCDAHSFLVCLFLSLIRRLKKPKRGS